MSEPLPNWDPLQLQVDLPSSRSFFPLGFTLTVRTNSRLVLDAAEQSWPNCERRFEADPLELAVLVSEDEREPGGVAPTLRAHGHLLSAVADSGHFAACDLEAGKAACWIGSGLAARQADFRYHYLEALAYFMLSYRDLTPIHGSCVASGGRGVILSAKPGSGKSCLAYACARAGLTFVSDDVSYLVRRAAEPLLLGRPNYLRLLPSAAELFGPLAGRPTPGADGAEQVLEIRVDQIEGVTALPSCTAAHLVFLERVEGRVAAFSPVGPDDAMKRLVQGLPVCSGSVNREQVESLGRLVERGALQLVYGDLAGAVERISGLLGAPPGAGHRVGNLGDPRRD